MHGGKAPSYWPFLPASLMHFCSGKPMHFSSGVDKPFNPPIRNGHLQKVETPY